MTCRETSSGDILTVEILPCYGRGAPKVSIVNTAVDGKVMMNEVFSSSSNYSLTRIIGGQPSQFIITVANHTQPLTLGVAVSFWALYCKFLVLFLNKIQARSINSGV